MTVSILNLHCLNAVCDDYENLAGITEEVRRSSHGNVGNAEIAECLTEMVAAGLIDVFSFNPGSGHYLPVPIPMAAEDDLSAAWFLITTKGRGELTANWVNG